MSYRPRSMQASTRLRKLDNIEWEIDSVMRETSKLPSMKKNSRVSMNKIRNRSCGESGESRSPSRSRSRSRSRSNSNSRCEGLEGSDALSYENISKVKKKIQKLQVFLNLDMEKRDSEEVNEGNSNWSSPYQKKVTRNQKKLVLLKTCSELVRDNMLLKSLLNPSQGKDFENRRNCENNRVLRVASIISVRPSTITETLKLSTREIDYLSFCVSTKLQWDFLNQLVKRIEDHKEKVSSSGKLKPVKPFPQATEKIASFPASLDVNRKKSDSTAERGRSLSMSLDFEKMNSSKFVTPSNSGHNSPEDKEEDICVKSNGGNFLEIPSVSSFRFPNSPPRICGKSARFSKSPRIVRRKRNVQTSYPASTPRIHDKIHDRPLIRRIQPSPAKRKKTRNNWAIKDELQKRKDRETTGSNFYLQVPDGTEPVLRRSSDLKKRIDDDMMDFYVDQSEIRRKKSRDFSKQLSPIKRKKGRY